MLTTLAVLIVIGAGLYVTGYFMPVTLTGAAERLVVQKADQVYRAALDGTLAPMSAELAKSVTRTGDGAWTEDLGRTTITVETVEAVEPSRIVRRTRDLKMSMTGETEILIAPARRGTYVAVSTEVRLENGHVLAPLMRLLATVFKGTQKGVEAYLDHLEKRLNRGGGFEAPSQTAAELLAAEPAMPDFPDSAEPPVERKRAAQ